MFKVKNMLTEIEQENSDIDWFFTNNEEIAFVASGGGKLPHSVAKSSEKNKILISFFRGLPPITDIVINPDLSKIIANPFDGQYLSDFIYMAKKGLFSFDKTVLNDFSEPNYHLVVSPVDPLKFRELPLEIINILSESDYNGAFGEVVDVGNVK